MSKFLHNLIHSLSTSEKVHFKRSSRVHCDRKDKNYLKIYDAYDEMETYDKNKINTLFKGTTLQKFHSSEVSYLKEKILISLYNYNLNRSQNNLFQKGILIAETLVAKGFKKEAFKKIKALKTKAINLEEFMWVLKLIELEEKVLFKEGIIGYKEKLERLHIERNTFTSTIQNLNRIHIIRQEIRELQFSLQLQVDSSNAINYFCENELVKDISLCKSNKAKEDYLYIQVLLNYLTQNFKKSLYYSIKHVQFIIEHDYLFDDSKLFPALSNYLYQAALTKNKSHYNKSEKLLKKFSKILKVSPYYIKYIMATRKLEFMYYTKDDKGTKRHFGAAENLLNNHLENLEESQIQYLFMLVTRACIVLKDFEKAMFYSNLWISRGALSYRIVQARLFSIIIHYEQELYQLLNSEIELLKKLKIKNRRDKDLLSSMYTFIKSVTREPTKKVRFIKNFQAATKSIATKNKGYYNFISFNFHEWSMELKD